MCFSGDWEWTISSAPGGQVLSGGPVPERMRSGVSGVRTTVRGSSER